MREPASTDLISDCLKRLNAAFPRNIGKQNPEYTLEVYKTGLRGLSGESIRAAVDRAIQDEEFFPKVSKLREMANAWAKYNQAQTTAEFERDPLWCSRCQSRAEYQQRWRVKTVEVPGNLCKLVVTHDGAGVELESYERLLCRCHPAPAYSPELSRRDPCVLVRSLTPYDKHRLEEQAAPRQRVVPPKRTSSPNVGDVAEHYVEQAAEHEEAFA